MTVLERLAQMNRFKLHPVRAVVRACPGLSGLSGHMPGQLEPAENCGFLATVRAVRAVRVGQPVGTDIMENKIHDPPEARAGGAGGGYFYLLFFPP